MELAGRIAHKCRLLDSQHKLLFFDHAHIVQKLWSAFLVLFYLLGVPLILASLFRPLYEKRQILDLLFH